MRPSPAAFAAPEGAAIPLHVLRAEAQQIRHALQRIANGTYGVCANCGKDIPKPRLEAQPMATRCVACAG